MSDQPAATPDAPEATAARAELAFVATAPRGLTDLVAQELASLGLSQPRQRGTSVHFHGPLESGYRACLWSRVASRILLQLAEFDAPDTESFYQCTRALDWSAHIDPASTIACEFTGTHPTIAHSHFGALRLKDAICDSLRERTGQRPDVDAEHAAIRVHAHAQGSRVTLSLDLAGEALHRRGYRHEAGAAPLRENLAAGILLRSRWPDVAARGGEFLDPFCGSGTLVIEAAWLAADRAPGLGRAHFGFLAWQQHDAPLWQRLCAEAQARVLPAIASRIRGSDLDQRVLGLAAANAERAGVAALVQFEHRPVSAVRPLGTEPGLVCTNPPYGERIGDAAAAQAAYGELGQTLRHHFAGWESAILSASPEAARALRLRNYRVHEFWNGAIACKLLRIDLSAPGAEDAEQRRVERSAALMASPGAQMFANRLKRI